MAVRIRDVDEESGATCGGGVFAMSGLSMTAAAASLFLLFSYIIGNLLELAAGRRKLRSRLKYESPRSVRNLLLRQFKAYAKLRNHWEELLETLRLKITADQFAGVSCVLLLTGIAMGGMYFQTAKGTLLFGCVAGFAPYAALRGLLIHRRMQAQLDFLPAVELFYQCYLVTGEHHVRTALQRTIEEKRLLGPMQAVFEQLYRNLSVRGDDDTSLRIMASSLGHVWADYFANIMRVALTEGGHGYGRIARAAWRYAQGAPLERAGAPPAIGESGRELYARLVYRH